MTPLAALLATATDDELRATRRLLHRAFLTRDRLGWPSVAPLDWMHGARQVEGEPVLLAAACLELSAELVRRGAALPCLPCLGTVEQFALLRGTEGVTAGDLAPVPSAGLAAAGSGGS